MNNLFPPAFLYTSSICSNSSPFTFIHLHTIRLYLNINPFYTITKRTVTISTTLPCVEDDMIQPIETPRLIIRPLLHPTDLKAYRTIRSQPEAMTSSNTGLPDASLEQTEAKLKRLQPPYRDSHVYLGIFLKNSDTTAGDIIGDGGVHKFTDTETGWPEFGYKLKKEYWGLGYATEFAKAFMQYWWNEIPRNHRRISILASSLNNQNGTEPAEQVCAWTKRSNEKSERVLAKSDLRDLKDWIKEWPIGDSRKIFSKARSEVL